VGLFRIFLSAFLIENVVFMQFLALCSYLGMSSDVGQSVGMGVAVTFVTLMATLVTWPLYHFVLAPLGLGFLDILAFILVIASLVQLVEFYLKKNVPGLYAAMGIYLPLITTNCAILAVTFNSISRGYDLAEALVYAFGSALGFTLALILLAGVRQRISSSPVPSWLKGPPILFVITALLPWASWASQGWGGRRMQALVVILVTAPFSGLLAWSGFPPGLLPRPLRRGKGPHDRPRPPGPSLGQLRGCGYPGCDGYAEAIVLEGEKVDLCTTGGKATLQALQARPGSQATWKTAWPSCVARAPRMWRGTGAPTPA
jgi:electron transport complex protein RnfA